MSPGRAIRSKSPETKRTRVGSHTGTFLGVPPTGRRVTLDQVEIWRIENDKIVEHWGGLAETERLYNDLVRGDD